MPTITVANRNFQTHEAREGSTILNVMRRDKAPWYWVCGANAQCGTCAVLVVEGEVSEPTDIEKYFIEDWGYDPGFRLACQTKIEGDVTVIYAGDVRHVREDALALLRNARNEVSGA